MRRNVDNIAWPVLGAVLLGAAGGAWLAIYPGDPTQRSLLGAISGTIALIGIVAAVPLLFIAAKAPVRSWSLPLIPLAIGAYSLAGLATFDPFYWPQRVRYIDHLSTVGVAAIAAASLAVAILVWWDKLLGAAGTVFLIVGLFVVAVSTGAH